jgi:hypothetical protein
MENPIENLKLHEKIDIFFDAAGDGLLELSVVRVPRGLLYCTARGTAFVPYEWKRKGTGRYELG